MTKASRAPRVLRVVPIKWTESGWWRMVGERNEALGRLYDDPVDEKQTATDARRAEVRAWHAKLEAAETRAKAAAPARMQRGLDRLLCAIGIHAWGAPYRTAHNGPDQRQCLRPRCPMVQTLTTEEIAPGQYRLAPGPTRRRG